MLAGALAGFWWYNKPPATIFMGDVGSYFIGFSIATATLMATFAGEGLPRHAVLAPLCVLAVPIYDTLSVIAIRLRAGRSPFEGDRNHFSHRLIALGLSPKQAVWTIYLLSAACGLGALLLLPGERAGRGRDPADDRLHVGDDRDPRSAPRGGIGDAMAKKRKVARRRIGLPTSPTVRADVGPPVDRWQSVLLAAFVALVVARTFVPEDGGGQLGHGAPFACCGWCSRRVAVGEFRRSRVRLRFDWADAFVVALVAWHTLSAVAAIRIGPSAPGDEHALRLGRDGARVPARAADLARSGQDARATIVVMLGLACGMSAVAIHQYFVTMPKDIAAFDAAKHSTQELFEQTGQWLPAGSSVRQQFEARLDSRLPAAAFALSNSMAGFLGGMVHVLVGIVFELRNRAAIGTSLAIAASFGRVHLARRQSQRGLAAVVGVALVLADRVIAGAGCRTPGSAGRSRPLWLGACGAGRLAVATSFGKTALDAAWRSVAFRLEYWRATLAMIADYPLFGCGPGQFQDTYTAYKLVGAAEEIQDPHNWLLEVWANAGTPAAILLWRR